MRAPCGVSLEFNEDFLMARWAALWFDFETGESLLTNDPALEPEGFTIVVMFTCEGGYGHGMWFRHPVITIDIENYEYAYGISLHLDEPMRLHIRDLSTEHDATVITPFGKREAHDPRAMIRVP